MKKFWTLMIAAGFAAVSGAALADDDKSAGDDGPDPRIGKQVDRICFQRNINGWRSVKGEDDVVLLERGVNNWFRVELLGGCDERVFRFAHAIGIDGMPGGGCVTRGDRILVEDGPGFRRSCVITRIYEWDDDAVADEEGDDEDDAAYEETDD